MTIAAGFLCRDAVLLCADTEHSGWATKSHHAKIGHFECPYGKVAFAVAGHTAFAWSAIQKLKSKLASIAPEDTISMAERILEKEYRRHVMSNPGYLSDSTLDYQLLLAFWTPLSSPELYVTCKTSLRKIEDFECIGIGGEFGSYLIRQGYMGQMRYDRALYLATYALAVVKDSGINCGGVSTFLILRMDGNVGFTTSESSRGSVKQIEKLTRSYDRMTKDLLLGLANPEMQESDVENGLIRTFTMSLLNIRRQWAAEWEQQESDFIRVNPHLDPGEARKAYRQLSMGLLPIPLPSQELPGGSGES